MTDLRADRLALLDDDRLLAVARNVKKFEKSEDLSDLVLELVERIENLQEYKWMYESLCDERSPGSVEDLQK